jgi:hypothetical protein
MDIVEPGNKRIFCDYPPPFTCKNVVAPSNTKLVFPPYLIKYINKFSDKSQKKEYRIASKKIVEEALIQLGSCKSMNPAIFEDARLRTFHLDDGSLGRKLATEDGMDASIHGNIACTVDSIIYAGNQSQEYAPLHEERIRSWLPKIKQIGNESVEGYALKTSLSDDSELFVMKAPRDPNNDELIHEAVIGFYAMNKLRTFLPNYMYVYGYTKCSPPTLNNKEAVTWCSSAEPEGSYLITENIRDAVTIGGFITRPDITLDDFTEVFLQVVNALNLAYKQYGYTHYDLHYGNIMVRSYSRVLAIPYYGTSFNVIEGYIGTRYIPYIIDYGYSRITIGGYGFGKIGLEEYGVDGARAFPMYDLYKLIGFLGEIMIRQGKLNDEAIQIYNFLEVCFSFFKEGTLRDRVSKRKIDPSHDFYGAAEKYRLVTHDVFIDFLTETYWGRLPIITDMSELTVRGIYQAPINTNLDTCAFYDLFAGENGPQNSVEYCEVTSAIESDSTMSRYIKKDLISWLDARFDADQYFKQQLPWIENNFEIMREIKSMRTLVNTGDIIPILTSSSQEIYSIEFVNIYREQIINLLKIKDIIAITLAFFRASLCSLTKQNNYLTNQARCTELFVAIEAWYKYQQTQRAIVEDNVNLSKNQNWSISMTERTVRKFWEYEHNNLFMSL